MTHGSASRCLPVPLPVCRCSYTVWLQRGSEPRILCMRGARGRGPQRRARARRRRRAARRAQPARRGGGRGPHRHPLARPLHRAGALERLGAPPCAKPALRLFLGYRRGRDGGGAGPRGDGEARARTHAGVVGGSAVGQLARVCAVRPLRGAGGGDVRAARHAAARAHGRRRPRALLPGLLPRRGAPPLKEAWRGRSQSLGRLAWAACWMTCIP